MAPPTRRSARDGGRRPVAAERVLAGRAWLGGRLQPIEVGVDADGRISALGRNVPGGRRHDVGDAVILPAATDPHVHLREPGGDPEVESIASGTLAAALGGVGLVGEMPNTEPAVTSVDRLEEKAERVRRRAAVDVLLYALPREVRAVAPLARRAGGFKIYLSPTTGIGEPPAEDRLRELLEAVARVDLPLVVHAEDPRGFVPAPPALTPISWDAARPATAEQAAVRTLLPGPARLRLHVAHATSSSTVAAVRDAGVSCEASPHHLLLSTALGRDARFKVNPPLRDEATRAALWKEYAEGRLPIVASDHAPHSAESKARPFPDAPSGVPGVETGVPLLLAMVARAELSLEVFLRTACDRPARLLGQPVGRLAVGHYANLLVVDFRRRRPVRADRLHTRCGWSPFEGFDAVFPREHWRHGERIVDGEEYVGRPDGTVVRPEYAPAARRSD